MTFRALRSAKTGGLVIGLLTTTCVMTGCDPKSGSGSLLASPDQAAALTGEQFTNPIMLRVGPDMYAGLAPLLAMHGVDTRPTNGAAYNNLDFRPCHVVGEPYTSETVNASIDGYKFPGDAVFQWLVRQQYAHVFKYPVHYTQVMFPHYGSDNMFVCVVVSEMIDKYISSYGESSQLFGPSPNSPHTVHGGFSVPLLRRAFSAWTYTNRYETALPGSGTAKVFAGTFTYKLVATIPASVESGEGTANVKVMLNPDTGKWGIASYELHDPALTLK